MFLDVICGQGSQREVTDKWRVDRSTVVHVCKTAKQRAMEALALSRPGRPGKTKVELVLEDALADNPASVWPGSSRPRRMLLSRSSRTCALGWRPIRVWRPPRSTRTASRCRCERRCPCGQTATAVAVPSRRRSTASIASTRCTDGAGA